MYISINIAIEAEELSKNSSYKQLLLKCLNDIALKHGQSWFGIRGVASLTASQQGGQEFHFPRFFLKFLSIILIFLKFSSSFWPFGWATRSPGKVLATPLFGMQFPIYTFTSDWFGLILPSLKQYTAEKLRIISNALCLRGYCTSNQKLTNFVLYLKISNTFVKNNVYISQ